MNMRYFTNTIEQKVALNERVNIRTWLLNWCFSILHVIKRAVRVWKEMKTNKKATKIGRFYNTRTIPDRTKNKQKIKRH